MKWFKHYANAQQSELLAEIIEEMGNEGYGIYWRLMELLCSNYDGDSTTFSFRTSTLKRQLGIKGNNKLRVICDLLASNPDLSGGKPVITANLLEKCVIFEAPIISKLQDRDFKKARKNRARIEENREEENRIEEKRTSAEINLSSGIDFDYFMSYWNDSMCPPFAPCKLLSEKRKTSIRRLLEQNKDFDLEGYCKKIINSPFLRGEKTDWKADFSWCFQHKNYLKVMDGKYNHSGIKTKAEQTQDKMLDLLREYENADRKSDY